MNKQRTLRVVNALLAADFAVLLLSALLRPLIPYDAYRIMHPISGYLLAALVATHLHLNWAWVKQNYLKKEKPKA